MESKTFLVPNIGCEGCTNTIKNELRTIAGIDSVEASPDTRMVTVRWGEPATWKKIVDVLEEIDYAPAEA